VAGGMRDGGSVYIELLAVLLAASRGPVGAAALVAPQEFQLLPQYFDRVDRINADHGVRVMSRCDPAKSAGDVGIHGRTINFTA
jgi:hypothetical protein